MKNKPTGPDINTIETSTEDFLQYYNQSIPDVFPKASMTALETFMSTHAGLFGKKKTWSRDKHRKRLMDWMFSFKD